MFIRSERLFLRPCWPEDRATLASLGGAETVPPDPVTEVLGSDEPENRRSARFLVTLPGSGIIGAASLLSTCDCGHLWLWIAPLWRSRGFATEAAEALAEVARMLGHDQLEALVYLDNCSAIRLLGRTDFAAGRRVTGHRRLKDAREFPSNWFHPDLSGAGGGDGDGTGGGADTLAA